MAIRFVGLGLWMLCSLLWGCDPSAADLTKGPNPTVISVDMTTKDDGRGGVIAVDVDGDGPLELLVTKPGMIACYDLLGTKRWVKKADIHLTQQSEINGLPGWHAPGLQAADVDADGTVEVLFLSADAGLVVVNGRSGKPKAVFDLPVPQGARRWEHLVVADFRGKGDRDLLVQATDTQGYRMGQYLAAFALDEMLASGQPLAPIWQRSDFVANAHSGARVADLDGDGRDEVIGATLIGPDGELKFKIPIKGHVDAVTVADVRPDLPGLEVVALEEEGGKRLFSSSNRLLRLFNRVYSRLFPGGNHIFLYNLAGLIWKVHHHHSEPQNAAVGDFDPGRPGLEIWCRSRYDTNQKPFVIDASGQIFAEYPVNEQSPKDWTEKGIEEIWPIYWNADGAQWAAAKERHESGDICIFHPLTGEFALRFKEKADRLYVADVLGDWREELIVVSGKEIHIYRNPDAAIEGKPRLWTQNHYRRSKMTWNYYNP